MSLIGLAAIVGAVITIAACVRMLVALKRNEGRDSVIGWFAIMLAAPVVVFAIDRIAQTFES